MTYNPALAMAEDLSSQPAVASTGGVLSLPPSGALYPASPTSPTSFSSVARPPSSHPSSLSPLAPATHFRSIPPVETAVAPRYLARGRACLPSRRTACKVYIYSARTRSPMASMQECKCISSPPRNVSSSHPARHAMYQGSAFPVPGG